MREVFSGIEIPGRLADVWTACLDGRLKRRVFMRQPMGFGDVDHWALTGGSLPGRGSCLNGNSPADTGRACDDQGNNVAGIHVAMVTRRRTPGGLRMIMATMLMENEYQFRLAALYSANYSIPQSRTLVLKADWALPPQRARGFTGRGRVAPLLCPRNEGENKRRDPTALWFSQAPCRAAGWLLTLSTFQMLTIRSFPFI
ncbi:MAG: hypothetical protein BJ554DRAFT_5424 [Olpidium bornovanus]|uniref:Uncharacterized protein n=1 Tax=Olpidium bornovanus TaxID=278681 RepID=A0A8H7ZZM1_9FUNG|nr:MAG: hypothetical protein BJ554DRAFT_5424 [Olpidium bornovanus]